MTSDFSLWSTRVFRRHTPAIASVVLLLYSSLPLLAQQPPWPNGCSILLPTFIQQGLDGIFHGACDNHDRCWAQCNGPTEPFLDFSHKLQCDQTFLGELAAACAKNATILSFPLGDLEDAAEFLTVCEAAATTMFGAVSTFGTNIFWESQCFRGCNDFSCKTILEEDLPLTCGSSPINTGPGFCYTSSSGGGGGGGLSCDLIDDPLQETTPDKSVECTTSPIVIDLGRPGIVLTGTEDPVLFDIDGDGFANWISWTAADSRDAFCVLDRNGNGTIDDGSELFGDATEQPPSPEPNGFLALAVFDTIAAGGNEDGWISAADAVFDRLQLWTDENHDGVSQRWELQSLADAGVEAIRLRSIETRVHDRHGNWFRWASLVRYTRGSGMGAWDVLFVPADEP